MTLNDYAIDEIRQVVHELKSQITAETNKINELESIVFAGVPSNDDSLYSSPAWFVSAK